MRRVIYPSCYAMNLFKELGYELLAIKFCVAKLVWQPSHIYVEICAIR